MMNSDSAVWGHLYETERIVRSGRLSGGRGRKLPCSTCLFCRQL